MPSKAPSSVSGFSPSARTRTPLPFSACTRRCYKALAYSVSAFLPAIVGGLYFFKSGIIEPGGAFDLTGSIEAIVMVMLGGLGTVTGAALGAFLYEELRGVLLTTEAFSHFQLVIAGVVVTRHRAVRARAGSWASSTGAGRECGGCSNDGAPRSRRHQQALWRRAGRARSEPHGAATARSSASSAPTAPASRPCSISSTASIRPISGRIVFKGEDITGKPPYRIARHGLARAHQIVQPLTGMTVLENCTVGACFGRENLPLARAQDVVREVAEIVGLADRLDQPRRAIDDRRQETAGTCSRAERAPRASAARRGARRSQSDRDRANDRR